MPGAGYQRLVWEVSMCNLKVFDMQKELKTYSVLIAWDDSDDEAGDYGTTVRAADQEEAERLAREEMKANHIENFGHEGEEHIQEDGTFGGRLLELQEGAIWKAKDLEKALRDLLVACRLLTTGKRPSEHVTGPYNAAVKLLDEIDSY
jgi:hypothetical protein